MFLEKEIYAYDPNGDFIYSNSSIRNRKKRAELPHYPHLYNGKSTIDGIYFNLFYFI